MQEHPQQHGDYPPIDAYQRGRERVHGKTIALPLDGTLPESVTAIAESLERLTGGWNPVMIYTASKESRDREQTRFFSALEDDTPYEPSFEYPFADAFVIEGARDQLHALLQDVRAIDAQNELDRLAKVALYFKIKDDIATCDLVEGIQARNDTQIGRGLTQKYPSTDPLLAEHARKLYREACQERIAESTPAMQQKQALREQVRALRFDAHDVKEAYEWALRQYGMLHPEHPQGFRVVIDPEALVIDVRDKCEGGPTIFIPADEDQDGEELLYLIAHEIEGHVRQAMNGQELFRIGGALLRTDDETLYEGLAMRQEEAFVRKHFGEPEGPEAPLYVLAIELAEQGKSFSQIFRDQEERWLHIYGIIDADLSLPKAIMGDHALREKARQRAWRTTYRVMRGHTDMQNPDAFAMAKDLAYLRGKLLDEKLRALGLGAVNESAIISVNGLPLLSHFDVTEASLPHPYRDVASDYLQILLARSAT